MPQNADLTEEDKKLLEKLPEGERKNVMSLFYRTGTPIAQLLKMRQSQQPRSYDFGKLPKRDTPDF